MNMSKKTQNMSKMGKTLIASTRSMVYNIVKFCALEKAANQPIINVQKVTERVAAMTGLSRTTISKIKKEGATNKGVWCTPGQHRKGRPKKINLNDSDKSAIRCKINEFYTRNEVPTLRKLHRVLKEEINFCGGVTSLREVLKDLGYTYKKLESNRKILTECVT